MIHGHKQIANQHHLIGQSGEFGPRAGEVGGCGNPFWAARQADFPALNYFHDYFLMAALRDRLRKETLPWPVPIEPQRPRTTWNAASGPERRVWQIGPCPT